MSTAVLRKSQTLGITSVLYPEEDALFCAYADELSYVYQDTNGYLRDYYCMNSPSFVYLRVLYCIRATGMNSFLYLESMIEDLWKSMEEDLFCASIDDSSNVYEDTKLYLREDRIKMEEEEYLFCASVAL